MAKLIQAWRSSWLNGRRSAPIIDEGEHYEYVYDVFGRLRLVPLRLRERWRIVAVYRADTTTGDLDDDPKEQFVCRATNPDELTTLAGLNDARDIDQVSGGTGLDGYGSGSYIDAVILRDRDANATGGWAGEADGVLEERRYYCQNWRHDVVAIVTAA